MSMRPVHARKVVGAVEDEVLEGEAPVGEVEEDRVAAGSAIDCYSGPKCFWPVTRKRSFLKRVRQPLFFHNGYHQSS